MTNHLISFCEKVQVQLRRDSSSLALAYVANKYGLDVTDFRGGDSLELFANSLYFMFKSISVEKIGTNGIGNLAELLLENVVKGKEYLLQTGDHSAIIRMKKNGSIEYLELQNINGFKGLDLFSESFEQRFSVSKKNYDYDEKLNDYKYYSASLTDIEKISKLDKFKEILGYLNTKKD